MAAMTLETTATRLWKRLGPAERLAAATHLVAEPAPEAMAAAFAAIVRVRHMRPQAVRAMSPDTQARTIATLLEPGESLAASLLVALHLGDRRPLLRAFLDGLGLPHEDGILKEEDAAMPAATLAEGRKGVEALASFPAEQVAMYLNTLYLQDPDRWAVVAEI